MHVLLINPFYDRRSRFRFFAKYFSTQPPTSLGFLAAYCMQEGFKPVILDQQIEDVDAQALGRIIRQYGIRIAGITTNTVTAHKAYEIGALLKKYHPEVLVVMGGIHVSLLPEEPLVKGVADVVVRDEGEVTFGELVKAAYGAALNLEDISGISFRKEGQIRHNANRELIKDLNTLPLYPHELFIPNKEKYTGGMGSIITSRGCLLKCAFCSQTIVNRQVFRTYSVERSVRELDRLVALCNPDFVFFNNDNFVMSKKYTHELCDLVISRKYPSKLTFGCCTRATSVDKELLQHMRAAGFSTVFYGVDTGVDRIMRLMNKQMTLEQSTRTVQMSFDLGFIVFAQFIIGYPTETLRETWQTIRYSLSIPLHFTRYSLLIPYPGSKIYNELRPRGPHTSPDDWAQFSGGLLANALTYVPSNRSPRGLLLAQWIAHFLFYLRPRQLAILHKFKAASSTMGLPNGRSLRGMIEALVFAVYFVGRFLSIFITPKIRVEMRDPEKIQQNPT